MLYYVLESPPHVWGQGGVRGSRGGEGEQGYATLCFRVPTTCVGARGEGE